MSAPSPLPPSPFPSLVSLASFICCIESLRTMTTLLSSWFYRSTQASKIRAAERHRSRHRHRRTSSFSSCRRERLLSDVCYCVAWPSQVHEPGAERRNDEAHLQRPQERQDPRPLPLRHRPREGVHGQGIHFHLCRQRCVATKPNKTRSGWSSSSSCHTAAVASQQQTPRSSCTAAASTCLG